MTAKPNHFELNAMLNMFDENGKLQLHKDREALHGYFRGAVNQNTVFFHSLEEKLEYLIAENYYEAAVLEQFDPAFVKTLFKRAYERQYRFSSFFGAYKFYSGYAMKTFDGDRYLERFEDRVCMTALYHARGNEQLALDLVDEIVSSRYQPATPTFLNAGRQQRGEMVSCFLLRIEDNMNSIGRAINAALQLSKRGGGVAFLLTNLREMGAPIKKIENQASGVIPIMKILEDAFSYANQLGARSGAGAVYLNAHHPDILQFLDTKRENADEKIRIKTLSLGVVVPDITFELAKHNRDMYLFSPYDVERVYGVPMSDLSITEHYQDMVDNPEITKTKINARLLFERFAELQFESGYPYLMFEDNVNRANPNAGWINMSNLCVAPESPLLTDQGEFPIATLEGQTVNVYNGEEFTETVVRKTGEQQKLLHVSLSDGRHLDCTEYHKWYIVDGKQTREVRTHELNVGDKLIKWKAPLIEGTLDLGNAYLNGFYSGDGTLLSGGVGRIYLYGEKMSLVNRIGSDLKWRSLPGLVGISANTDQVGEKFFVPDASYTIASRLEWLAGFLDADGTVARNGDNETLTMASINSVFLGQIQSMLMSLGVHSKVRQMRSEGMSSLPLNDGSGRYGEFPTKPCYRLLITSNGTQELYRLGLNTSRLAVVKRQPQRDATHFVVVTDVSFEGRYDDTYCVTEEKRHMAVFNGILTGNCTEILQVNTPSVYDEDLGYDVVGKDISCNLGSMNIAKAMEGGNLGKTVETAVRALTSVSEQSNINCVPSIHKGNNDSRAIGLGQMNLHGFFAKHHMPYGSPESIEFTDLYFMTVAYHAYRASNLLAIETGSPYKGFETSQYATGAYFDKYVEKEATFTSQRVEEIFEGYGVKLPTLEEWTALRDSIRVHGLYNSNLQAIPPTGSISYINYSTASIHPVAAAIEVRKEGRTGRVYYPAPYLTDENMPLYEDAYAIGPEKIIDVYAAATPHVDQGASLTLFFPDTATTRDITKAQIYAWTKGIKTLYYSRIRQSALEGTEIEGCVSCSL